MKENIFILYPMFIFVHLFIYHNMVSEL